MAAKGKLCSRRIIHIPGGVSSRRCRERPRGSVVVTVERRLAPVRLTPPIVSIFTVPRDIPLFLTTVSQSRIGNFLTYIVGTDGKASLGFAPLDRSLSSQKWRFSTTCGNNTLMSLITLPVTATGTALDASCKCISGSVPINTVAVIPNGFGGGTVILAPFNNNTCGIFGANEVLATITTGGPSTFIITNPQHLNLQSTPSGEVTVSGGDPEWKFGFA